MQQRTRPSAAQQDQAGRRSLVIGAVVAVALVAVVALGASALAPQDATTGASRPNDSPQITQPLDAPAGAATPGDPAGDAASAADAQIPSSTFTIVMAGDVLPHERVWQSGALPDGGYSFDHLFSHFAQTIAGADLAIVNQETILGAPDRPLEDYPEFNSPQAIGDAEANAGFDVVLKATNHTMDQGYDGLAEELAFWRGAHPDVLVAGVCEPYETTIEESAPVVFESRGWRIAVVNATYDLNGYEDYADAIDELDADQAAADMAYAESNADFTIVCPHWGIEMDYEPSDEQREWAQRYADLGADLILGGHPHVLQPVELLESADGRQVPVYWSVGNFISDMEGTAAQLGGLAQVTLERGEAGAVRVASCRLVPLVSFHGQGTAFSAWPLADYTEELAADNADKASERIASRQEHVQTCIDVLGPGFDPAACTFALDLAA